MSSFIVQVCTIVVFTSNVIVLTHGDNNGPSQGSWGSSWSNINSERTWDDNLQDLSYINYCYDGDNSYDRMMIFSTDVSYVDNIDGQMNPFMETDTTGFFVDIMGWDDTTINKHRISAETWLYQNYGIDFSTIPLSNPTDITSCKKYYDEDGTTLLINFCSLLLKSNANYRVILDTNTNEMPNLQKDDCPYIRDGGWIFLIESSFTTPNGLYLETGDTMFYGFYINERSSPSVEVEVIHYGGFAPMRKTDLDGWGGIKCKVWIPDENFLPIDGSIGHAIGLFTIKEMENNPNKFVMRSRNVLTWGAYSPYYNSPPNNNNNNENPFEYPPLCNSQPCSCNEVDDTCIICHSGQGCSQCNDGYFQKDVNTHCVSCVDTFGNDCLHCSNGEGCQQCNNGIRTFDHNSGLYYCLL